MYRRRQLLPPLLLAAWTCAAVWAGPGEPLPKAEEILDKFVEATGGKAAYEKVHNEKLTGTFELVGKGIKGTITSYRAEPNKSSTSVELEGVGTVKEGTDGETAWETFSLQGPRIKTGDERAVALREAALRGPLEWRKLYKHVETAGSESVDNQPCYRIVLTPDEGKPETQLYDKKTGLLLKSSMTVTRPEGDIPTETVFSDYQESGGLRIPHTVRQKALGQEILITFDHADYNVEVPANQFDLPADVKALLAK